MSRAPDVEPYQARAQPSLGHERSPPACFQPVLWTGSLDTYVTGVRTP